MVVPAKAGRHGDTFFDPWLKLANPIGSAHPLVREVLETLASHENRQRKRRQVDRENHQDLLELIVANMVRAVLHAASPHAIVAPLARPTQAATRYDRPALRKLKVTLLACEKRGFLHLWVSKERDKASSFRPSEAFIAAAAEVEPVEIGQHQGAETILLRQTDRGGKPWEVERTLIDYRDTPETIRLREEMATINRHLASADIAYDGGEGVIDPSRRRLRRSFNLPPGYPIDPPRFDMGGRLFDGWWETLKSSNRHLIRIGGRPVIELDYSGMFVRLAHLHVGAEPPEGDLYRMVRGVVTEDHRAAVKKTLNALFFGQPDNPRAALVKGTRALLPRPLRCMPVLRDAILGAHPVLSDAIDTDIGYRLMHTESRIMVAVLLRLIGMGITALPLHDGLLVADDRAEEAKSVMGDVAVDVTGCRLPVVRKPALAIEIHKHAGCDRRRYRNHAD